MRRQERDREYTEFFATRARALRRTAFGLCGDWATAEDLVSTVFIRLYASWDRVRLESADAYARKVLLNQFLAGRRRRKFREIPADLLPDIMAAERDQDTALDVVGALHRLPARQRAIVVLRYLDDLSVHEVADLLGITEGTVKSQSHRALGTLRFVLEPIDPRIEHGRPDSA